MLISLDCIVILLFLSDKITCSPSPISSHSFTTPKSFYLRSINPMIEKINPTIPIPITSSPIPDEQREIIMAKSSIAIPNPIFFIVNPPLQIPICFSISYSNYTIKLVNNSTATLDCMRKVRTVFCPDFLAQS